MAITEIEVFNLKRIKWLRLRPRSGVNVISGPNASGKSSALDAIEMAILGKRIAPPKPIRDGEKSAAVRLELDGIPEQLVPPMTVMRRFDLQEDGSIKSELTIEDRTDPEHAQAPSPQTLLNDAAGVTRLGQRPIAFSPLAFARMPAKDQVAMLRQLVTLDFAELDAKKAALAEQRADVGREGKAVATLLAKAVHHPDATEPIDIAELRAEYAAREQEHADAATKRDALARAEVSQVACEQALKRANDALRDIEKKITELQAEAEAQEGRIAAALETLLQANKVVAVAAEAVPDFVKPLSEVMARIEAANAHNAKHEANERRKELAENREALLQEYAGLTQQIEEIEAQKKAAIAAAKWPLPGLGFDADGVTFNGRPLEQASSAEQLEISVAIGCALNPALKVMLVREGSLLDAAHMTKLAEIAERYSAQVFVERCDDYAGSHVKMRDGEAESVAPEVKA